MMIAIKHGKGSTPWGSEALPGEALRARRYIKRAAAQRTRGERDAEQQRKAAVSMVSVLHGLPLEPWQVALLGQVIEDGQK